MAEAKRKNSVTIEGRLIKSQVKNTTKGDILLGTLMFGGSKEKGSNFINIALWKPSVEEVDLVESAVTNKTVLLIEGYLRQNKWQDREGKNRSSIDLGINNVQVSEVQPPRQNVSETQERNSNVAKSAAPVTKSVTPPAEDDIPF